MNENAKVKLQSRQKNLARALWLMVLVAGSGAVAYFAWPCRRSGECEGGTVPGLILGFLALCAIFISVAYWLRKTWIKHSLLSLEQWLYSHVIIGTLTLYLVVAHSGFHLRNQIAVIALGFLALTVLSGVIGLFLIYFLPRNLARHTAAVLVPDELLKRLSRLHEELSELCSQRGGVFLEIYNELVIPLYRTQVGKEPPSADLHPWEEKAPAGEAEAFMQLAAKTEEAHDVFILLGRHMRFQWWIRGWLLFHVPATIGLLVFTAAHILSVTWYGVP